MEKQMKKLGGDLKVSCSEENLNKFREAFGDENVRIREMGI